MEMKLFDSELRLMELLWAHPQDAEPLTAKEISLLAAQQIGCNKNTTYTVIKKLVDKNAIRREEPGFQCIPLISRNEAQRQETRSLLQKLFGGSKKALFSALLEDESLTAQDIADMRAMIDKAARDGD